jgi:hypothetical protein
VRRPWTWWLAWGTWAATLGLYAVALAIQQVVGHSAATQQEGWVARGTLLAAFVAFATVGALVASRQPRNAVGWMFVAIGALVALSVSGGEYANYVFVEEPGAYPGGYLAGWLYVWTWFPVISLIVILPLVFPDGRPPGPRWQPALGAMIAGTALITALWWVRPGPMNDPDMGDWPDNPIGIGALEGIHGPAEALGTLMLAAFLLISAASMVVRFRRSTGDEREQLKWVTYAACVMAFAVVLSPLVGGDLGDFLFGLTIGLLPAATAVAVFKYRLYEIDRVISRTLVYAALTVILGAAYVGLVLVGQAVFSSFAGGSDLAIAVSTLVVAALFLPLRGRVQRLVDRRFYRRRYDAQRTLEAFGARLREEVDLDALAAELGAVVTETMQPAHVSVWRRSEALP